MTLKLNARAIWTTTVSLLALLVLAVPASAQFGEAAGIAEAMQQDYYRRDVRLFEEGLALDEAQRTIVESLYGDYEQEFEQGLAGMRKRIEDMRPELQSADPNAVLGKVFKPIEDWAVEKGQISERFLENVKVVLTLEQQENWPKFERFLFREKNLSRGRLSGESLNLFYIVRDLGLNPIEMQQVQPVLDEYDIALDTALRNRQKLVTGRRSEMLKSFAEQDSNVSLAILQNQVEMQVAVRRVNDGFIERLAEVVPAEKQAEFRQTALERAYPRVYRPTPVQNIFKAAKELQGLDPAVLAAVVDLEASYLSELSAINHQLVTLVRDWEPREMRLRAEAFAKRMNNAQPEAIEDPTREAFMRRDEVSRNYARQLQALLTPEQFAQLPGGYRWADNPAEQKPHEAMPTGEGGPTHKQRGGVGEGESEGESSGRPTRGERPD